MVNTPPGPVSAVPSSRVPGGRSRRPALTGRIPPTGGGSSEEKFLDPKTDLFPNYEGRIDFDVSWACPDGLCAVSVSGCLPETDVPLSTIRQKAEKRAEAILEALALILK
jgi:hypothetical protein